MIPDSVQMEDGTFSVEATYKISTISYICKIGGDGYSCFKDPLKAKVVSDEDCEVTLLDFMLNIFENMKDNPKKLELMKKHSDCPIIPIR